MMEDEPGCGWFTIPGQQAGVRTLEQQLKGLGSILADAPGRSVLDLGCAEGLVGLEFLKRGAVLLHGVEQVHSRVERAKSLCAGRPASFWAFDLQKLAKAPIGLLPAYDFVLALSIAHKMISPEVFLTATAKLAAEAIAVRLPSRTISDRRSGFRRVDVPTLLEQQGFALGSETQHELGEWIAVWHRKR